MWELTSISTWEKKTNLKWPTSINDLFLTENVAVFVWVFLSRGVDSSYYEILTWGCALFLVAKSDSWTPFSSKHTIQVAFIICDILLYLTSYLFIFLTIVCQQWNYLVVHVYI